MRWSQALAGAGLLAAALALVLGDPALLAEPGAARERLRTLRQGFGLCGLALGVHGLLLLGVSLRPPAAGPARPLWTPPPGLEPPAPRAEGALLVALLLAAVATRIPGLGSDLWLDEVFTLTDFVRPSLFRILSDYSSDNQHLLYSVAAHASVAAFGENPQALRLPALLFGVASLAALWRLGRLVAGPREALAATALLAFSYHHIWFSQNARGYTGLLLMTILSTDLLLRGLWQGRWRTWLAYAGVLALGMAVHLTMGFVALAQGLVVLVLLLRAGRLDAGRLRPLLALGLAGLFTFQTYALVLPQLLEFFTRPGGGSGGGASEWKSPLWMLRETLRGLGLGLALGSAGLVGAGVLFGSGLVSTARRSPALAALFLLPPLLGAATMIGLGRNLWPRFFFNVFGFGALFGVRGAMVLGAWAAARIPSPAWRPAPTAAGLVLAVGLVAASAVTLPRVYRHPKQDFSGARDFVLGSRAPGDRVVAVGLAGEAYRRYYAPDWPVAGSLEELRGLQPATGSTWVLVTLPGHLAATAPALSAALEREFETVRVFPGTVGDGAVWVHRTAR